MTDRPIIFSPPMVQALLAGRKTMTRRLLNPPKWSTGVLDFEKGEDGVYAIAKTTGCLSKVPIRYANGDRLWVRENVRGEEMPNLQDGVRYKADDEFRPIENNGDAAIEWLTLHTYRGHSGAPIGPWVPSIHMPRWASRLTLIVESVKVERLQDISADDAEREGCEYLDEGPGAGFWIVRGAQVDVCSTGAVECFERLWESIHGPEAWAANPWVAAIGFRVIKANIDCEEAASQ